MEAALTAQTPGLVSLYETFNELHGDERPLADPPEGAEPPRRRFWHRPRFAGFATLAVLAAVVALCATLSVELRPPTPSCLAGAPAAQGAASAAAAAQVRALDCDAYPTSK
jgi:hypothetical protein